MAIDVSVVVPVYNEEACVELLVERTCGVMDGTGMRYELILVDDGSRDRSVALATALMPARPALRLIRLRKNSGQTVAMDVGFKAARGRIVVSMDGDLQNDPVEIPRLLKILDRGEAEMVTGIRIRRRDNWVRRIASRIGNGFRNVVTGDRIDDVGCSLRVFRRECLEGLPVFKGMHRFFPTLVRMQGFRVQQVPVAHRPRPYGQTKYSIGNRMWSGMMDCFGVRWLKSRARSVRVQTASRRLETVRVQKGRYA